MLFAHENVIKIYEVQLTGNDIKERTPFLKVKTYFWTQADQLLNIKITGEATTI